MAEYTRNIEQLQKTASQQPSFAPPSQSLGGDIVNLVGTGLDFYAKNKAQDKLNAIAAEKKQQDTDFAEGVLGLREYEQQLEANNVTGNTYNTKINEYMRKYPLEVRLEIFTAKNKLTGRSSSAVASDLDKKAKEMRLKQEQTIESGSAYASGILGLDDATIATAGEQQLEKWSQKGRVLDAELARQKQIIEVSDDITAPILNSARAVLNVKSESLLERIKEAQRAGDTEGAKALGGQYRAMIMSAQINAPESIKAAMGDKGMYYDAKLVSAYTNEITGMLNNPRVKDVLSGKETSEENIRSVELVAGAYMRERFFTALQEVQAGEGGQRSIDDLKNAIEWHANVDIAGLSLSKTTEKTLLGAIGVKTSTPETDTGTQNNISTEVQESTSYAVLDVVSGVINDVTGFLLNKSPTEVIQEANDVTSEYITDKLDSNKELSAKDIAWIEDSLTFGNTGDIDKKGKGASKAVLQAPLKILARDDYNTTVKPAIDAARSRGVDPVAALTSSLENHIKNNVGNAFTEIVGLATSGMMGSPKTAISRGSNRPSMQTGDYNLIDIVELTQEKGQLKFKYKPNVLGQSTDTKKIYNLMNLNEALIVMNDYTKAISNVTGNEREAVADEMRGLLNRYVGIPLKEDKVKE